MDTLPLLLPSSFPLYKNHPTTQKNLPAFKPFNLFSNPKPPDSSFQSSYSTKKIPISLQTDSQSSPQNLAGCLSFAIIDLFAASPCLAAESVAETESGKINLESIVVSVDNFLNRYPFFVAGCTFIWLVAIPLTQEYFRKYKFISALDAYRKLRDDPYSQLLDIRDRKNLKFLRSPNLKILNKETVQVEFSEGDEDGFVKKVLESFNDAPNTVLCILDNFDGKSMKVAELLFKNGFKEAYAIRGGVRGEQGWMEIQDTLLPPSVHIYPRKKKQASEQLGTNGAIQQNEDNGNSLSPKLEDQSSDTGPARKSAESFPDVKIDSKASSSPYPNYPDMKPPSSPTPSKPQ
ncbi:rhodanese-like domain-containing protein 4A, chloroplastic isoform X1 [Neltuma alba]|uniref:rhodanese-like domain-containing protein 4A, chloroplastic isoform X1 n=1 Tax=Neltuma alba TaxID=207710 RepID=UPI0010A51DBA|nr:rhodanese-like domain-containing protein 4A, chloroplastic isoform X1 [Prosopis alba]XP_028791364.1 rhodanese-like domain-containing protein 4A, chloroplastic isoform X1 [Prosopis alba]XP_028791365.1 rhodanese-like domain-containing protein 4A, chloroplastic isoform X1 [Prosopis alba]XP_028791366.1 rhodanese-like domain-containing protein 4A, chloroplastic isoform X1 [Prosopis alba]